MYLFFYFLFFIFFLFICFGYLCAFCVCLRVLWGCLSWWNVFPRFFLSFCYVTWVVCLFVLCLFCIEQSNFVLPKKPCWPNHLYIVDFGLSKKWKTEYGGMITELEKADFYGTSLYASLTAHNNRDLSRNDDLWSLLFVIIDISTNALPWKEKYIRTVHLGTKQRRVESMCLQICVVFFFVCVFVFCYLLSLRVFFCFVFLIQSVRGCLNTCMAHTQECK